MSLIIHFFFPGEASNGMKKMFSEDLERLIGRVVPPSAALTLIGETALVLE